jgi:hypothetical protein
MMYQQIVNTNKETQMIKIEILEKCNNENKKFIRFEQKKEKKSVNVKMCQLRLSSLMNRKERE